MMLEITLGVVFATILVLYARSRGPKRGSMVLAVGLVVTALLYVGFALIGGANAKWSALEIVGVLPFSVFAWLGYRASSVWLALGWAAHVGWDVGLHLGGHAPEFVPPFFPTFCIGFDVVVAVYVASQAYIRWASRPPGSGIN